MLRRDILRLLAGTCALAACGGAHATDNDGPKPELELDAEKWKEVLSAEEFHILREAGTERAFTGDLWDHKGDGVFVCGGCGLPLFDSGTKFKFRHGLAELLRAAREGQHRRGHRCGLRHGAHRDAVRALRRPPRARVPRRSEADGSAVLHEQRGAGLRAPGQGRRARESGAGAAGRLARRQGGGCAPEEGEEEGRLSPGPAGEG